MSGILPLKRLLLSLLFCAMSLAFFVSCSKSSAPVLLVATALPKDEAILYLQDLKRQHPSVKVKLEYLTESQVIPALERKDAQRPDVLWGVSAVTLTKARDKGLLAPYAPARLARLNPKFYDSSNPEFPAWVGMRAYVLGFASSEHEQYKRGFDVPSSYEALLSDELRNSIIMPDPEKCGAGYIFLAGLVQKMGEEKAWEYFEKLRRNIKYFASDEAYPVRQAGRSNASVGISLLTRCNAEQKIGAPVIVTVPSDPVWDIQGNALVRKSNLPMKQAETFLDWTYSPTMMKMYSRGYPEVADSEVARSVSGTRISLPAYDIEHAAAEKERLLTEWRRRFVSSSKLQ